MELSLIIGIVNSVLIIAIMIGLIFIYKKGLPMRAATIDKVSSQLGYYNYLMELKQPYSFSCNKAIMLIYEDNHLGEERLLKLLVKYLSLLDNRFFTKNDMTYHYGDSNRGGATFVCNEMGYVDYLDLNLGNVFVKDLNRIDIKHLNVKLTFNGEDGDSEPVHLLMDRKLIEKLYD